MDMEEHFRQMVTRHGGLIRGLCVGYSGGDMERCRDLVQEVTTGMWLRFTRREARMPRAAQAAWVYWQTRHFISLALRRWKTGSMVTGALPETAEEECAEEALAVELAADLAGRERQLFDLLRQGFRNEEIADTMGVSMATAKRIRAGMVESMRRRAEALGYKTAKKNGRDEKE